jgi:hypothetical protein
VVPAFVGFWGKTQFERIVKMKRTAHKTLVLTVGVLAVTLFIAGCQDEQKQTNTIGNDKRSKLVAAENVALKRTIEEQKLQHAGQMQKQSRRHDKEMRQQKKRLDACQKENKLLEDMSKERVESYMRSVLGPLVDENEKLRKENEALKVQVQNLKGQVDRLKAE